MFPASLKLCYPALLCIIKNERWMISYVCHIVYPEISNMMFVVKSMFLCPPIHYIMFGPPMNEVTVKKLFDEHGVSR